MDTLLVWGCEFPSRARCKHCKSRLQRFQYPHMVEFVDELPKTVTGKIQRYKLREAAREKAQA